MWQYSAGFSESIYIFNCIITQGQCNTVKKVRVTDIHQREKGFNFLQADLHSEQRRSEAQLQKTK